MLLYKKKKGIEQKVIVVPGGVEPPSQDPGSRMIAITLRNYKKQ